MQKKKFHLSHEELQFFFDIEKNIVRNLLSVDYSTKL